MAPVSKMKSHERLQHDSGFLKLKPNMLLHGIVIAHDDVQFVAFFEKHKQVRRSLGRL